MLPACKILLSWYTYVKQYMNESVIAIVFDFDETLGPDTISFVLKEQNISPPTFWKEVNKMVESGWDPPLAYMHLLLKASKEEKLDISKQFLQRLGKKLSLFSGLPSALKELKQYVSLNASLNKSHITLEIYVISGGLEEIIRNTKLAPFINGIFGCKFAYDQRYSQPIGIQSAISFTEKTRFLHGIRKGIDSVTLRTDPYRINDAIDPQMQRIPFSRMIYIGDGPSDIPCLSPVVKDGGIGIGVSAPFGTFKKGYELARGKRITLGPYTANYKKSSDMRKILEEVILRIGLTIDIDRKKNVVITPTH